LDDSQPRSKTRTVVGKVLAAPNSVCSRLRDSAARATLGNA
jgi:hypothetical protein